ncbi:SusC/RagA family TonB-linked outer membrane protein [Niabella beijingensis]|uniref:SusC/RagA family TonB-linked outer membrane protein n=1 Tax=Niabella beijingensis TaxID=2872700 RepID=UPI001CC03FA9|nr:TonB-dependent receptor [Niabella beijingensis]MBZ4187335.1 TonB-dependent receptor [Niabella beijingensis]
MMFKKTTAAPVSYRHLLKRLSKLFLLFFIIAAALPSLAQQRQLQGSVSDDSGEKLPGVSVAVKGHNAVTQTGADGRFQITVPDSAGTLIFTYVGKETQEYTIGTDTEITIKMATDPESLEVVVVNTGYMTQRKADLTGAVSVVGRSAIAKNPSADVLRSIQGKVPGVYIRTDGNPTDNVSVNIRGITSINGSPPLIVLDGQPVNITLRDINPADIESMQILKDASSASIYGSRAAGGVILITTRKGKKGTPTVSYESYVGFSKMTRVPKMLDAEGYGRALWQATVNDGNDPATAVRFYNYDWSYDAHGVPVLNKVIQPEWLNETKTMPSANTNWYKEGTRTGIQQNHQLTITGGGERLTSLFSLNYYNNEGTQITSFLRRLSARFNNEYELIKGRLTIGENLTITQLRMKDANANYAFLVMPPNIPVYANDGMWGGVAMKLGMDDFNNPVRELTVGKENVPNFLKVLGSVYAELKILKNLSFKTQYGLDYGMWYQRYIDPTWEEAGGKFDDISGVEQLNWQQLGQTWTNTLLYNLVLGKNKIDILGGIESYRFIREDLRGYRSDIALQTRDYAYLDAASGSRIEAGGSGDERTLLSYFGKINYDYDSRYLLSATLRRDGSSVFGPNNRYGTFPAFSGGWRLTSESFFSGIKNIFSDLKLRAGWGQNGNQAPLSAGRLVNLYKTDANITSYDISGLGSGAIPSGYRRDRIGNPDLKWETTTQTNIGIDFGFLNNRLTGSFDWFNKKSSDMLIPDPPYIAALGEGGFRSINAADMSNKGFELAIGWQDTKKDFYYNITANAAAYSNKITSLPQNVVFQYGGNGLSDNILGRPIGSIYGLVADGIFKTQEEVDNSPEQPGKGLGRIRYKDLNGDGKIDEIYDRTWIGVSDPDLMAGLNFDARYKNFDLSFFIQGVFGNDVVNDWKQLTDLWNIGVQNDRNHTARVLDAWSPGNPNSDIPALTRGNANGEGRLSTYFVESGSYVKMRTLELGYSFPQQLINKWSMSRFRIYLAAQNLFTIKKSWGDNAFTGPDPEIPNISPNPTGGRPYGGYLMPFTARFGVNVTF